MNYSKITWVWRMTCLFLGIFYGQKLITYLFLFLFHYFVSCRLVVQTRVHNQRVEYKLSDNDSVSRWDFAHQLMDNAEAIRSQRLRLFRWVLLLFIHVPEYSNIKTLNIRVVIEWNSIFFIIIISVIIW